MELQLQIQEPGQAARNITRVALRVPPDNALAASLPWVGELVVTRYARGAIPEGRLVASVQHSARSATEEEEWKRFCKYMFHGLAGTSAPKAAILRPNNFVLLAPAHLDADMCLPIIDTLASAWPVDHGIMPAAILGTGSHDTFTASSSTMSSGSDNIYGAMPSAAGLLPAPVQLLESAPADSTACPPITAHYQQNSNAHSSLPSYIVSDSLGRNGSSGSTHGRHAAGGYGAIGEEMSGKEIPSAEQHITPQNTHQINTNRHSDPATATAHRFPLTGDIFAHHGYSYAHPADVVAASRDRGWRQRKFFDGIINLIVRGDITFPFKWKCITPEQLPVWFQALRSYPHARRLVFGPYKLHGYYPKNREVTILRDKIEENSIGPTESVCITADNVTLLLGKTAAYVPFDREYNEIGGTIVDYFSEDVRMKAIRKDEGACPLDLWRRPDIAKAVVEKAVRKHKEITDYSLRHGLYGKVSGCNLFKSHLARALYELFGGRRILDMCAGWGCRLMGAMETPQVQVYRAFDPNPDLVGPHNAMIRHFEAAAGGSYSVQPAPFEAGTFSAEEVEKGFDLALTSPPYFDLEIYEDPGTRADGSKQSIASFPGQSHWMEGWYWNMMDKAWSMLNEGGHLVIYINDHEREGREFLDLCYPMLSHASTLPSCVWVGVLGIEGETGTVRPLWIWRKGAAKQPFCPLYQEILSCSIVDGSSSPQAKRMRVEPVEGAVAEP